jgi:Raf kinase inhibitor-like YbhB/YbcL family protein
MYLRSSAFVEDGMIPQKYTCEGEGLIPPLTWGDVPQNARSLVLIMDDPDVPLNIRADGMWDHWVVWNIDPESEGSSEGAEPKGVHGTTTSGTLSYVPPCPPDGQHRYYFHLYALDTILNAREGSSKKIIMEVMQGHVIAEARLIGVYCKKEHR